MSYTKKTSPALPYKPKSKSKKVSSFRGTPKHLGGLAFRVGRERVWLAPQLMPVPRCTCDQGDDCAHRAAAERFAAKTRLIGGSK
jgi:hypothetical protein